MRDNDNAELNVHQEKFAKTSDWASERASAFDKKRGQNQKYNPVYILKLLYSNCYKVVQVVGHLGTLIWHGLYYVQ